MVGRYPRNISFIIADEIGGYMCVSVQISEQHTLSIRMRGGLLTISRPGIIVCLFSPG